MVQGGLPVGSSVVLQGPPGQEKLRFALTFLAEGLKSGGSGLVVTSSQSPDAVIAELRDLGVNLDSVTKENRLRVVDWYSWSEETVHDIEESGIVIHSSIDLTNLGVALSRAIAALAGGEPPRAVIELLSPATSSYEVTQVYAFAQSAKRKFDRHQFTSLVLVEKEMHSGAELTTLHQPFDGVIEIERTRSGDRIVRKIGVLHLKDTAPDPTFRVLEISEAGLRVVQDTPKPAAPVSSARGGVLESQDELAQRLRLILQIATERLKLNPRDADALFAMAAAQATLDDAKGGLQTLDRLADIDSTYPGLWVLKTKLHAKLGQADLAQQSRLRAQQSEPEPAKAIDATVPCPMCEEPVAIDATSCANCGVKFTPTRTLEDELDDLGHAAIQEMVQEDLGAPKETEKAPDKPTTRAPKPGLAPPVPPREKPTEKAPSKKGLTNGLALERRGSAKAGRTNGLRGRTNGLRGRTNGLTNGLGRTNGRTNGVGRTNGLTNGLGRTNGLTNGLGRTNGLTNGLGRTNGITNGLGRTNGLTNGLAGVRATGFQHFGRRGMMHSTGWKLYLIPLVTVGLLLLPLFFVPGYPVPAYPIRIDGQFEDWNGIPRLTLTSAAVNPNIDITRVAVTDNIDFLSFYAEVRGQALQGDPSSARTMDTFFVFIDADGSPATGYRIQGLGADRLIEIEGWGGQVVGATLFEFDANRDPRDWGGWFKATPVPAAASGGRIEFEAAWAGIVQPKAPIEAAFAARSWDGIQVVADTTATSANPFVLVRQESAAPQIVTGTQMDLAQFTFQAIGGDVGITSLNVSLQGTFTGTTFSSFALVDLTGSTLASAPATGSRVAFSSLSLQVPAGGSATLAVRPAVAVADGTTVGAFLAYVGDVVAGSAGVAFVDPARIPTSLAYVGTIPSGSRIDGGFAEWTNLTSDPTGDVTPVASRDLDISEYAFQASGANVSFILQTIGTALNGTLVPTSNRAYAGGGSSQPDSDRDSVPDSVDPFPNDFNNDGIPDAATNGDYDGDGFTDYGFPAGTDLWLNTTIPNNFPAPYAGRLVSVYIGPVQRPVERGEDLARFYLDQDGSAATGYAIGGIGADYLVEVGGKEGRILSSAAMRFNGSNPGQWSWTSLGSAPAAKDRSHIETALSGVTLLNASRAYFVTSGWSRALDDTSPTSPALSSSFGVTLSASVNDSGSSPVSGRAGEIHALDIAGNQKWFFTNGGTSGTSCSTNLAASTTAGASATSTTLSTAEAPICWFTPTNPPSTVAGPWEVILDIDKTSDGTKVLRPSANGDVNDWSAVSGCTGATAWDCVDDNPNDGDTSYLVSTFTTVTDSLFNIFDWSGSSGQPPSPLTVINVQVTASCRKTGAPVVSAKVLVKSGGVTSAGTTTTDCANSATYTVWTDTWTTDPSDGAAWTLADINALQVGIRDNDGFNREVRVSHVMATVTFVPAYTVQIDKCTNTACTSFTTLYGPTNGNTYGSDVTFTTPSISAQTFTGIERIRFLVQLNGTGTSQNHGSVTVRYNGPNPGTDDSRGTVAVPEFGELALPIISTMLLVPLARRWHLRRARKRESDASASG